MERKNRAANKPNQEVTDQSEGDAQVRAAQDAGRAATEETLGKIDDILDEIDDVLESNAEDFVRAFVQKGGQ